MMLTRIAEGPLPRQFFIAVLTGKNVLRHPFVI